MAKKKPAGRKPKAKPVGLKGNILAACKEAGFREEEFKAGGFSATKFGDGVLLGKFIKLVELLGPIFGPFLGLGAASAKATADMTDAEKKFAAGVTSAAARAGLTASEMSATASNHGIFGYLEKFLKFGNMVLPFLRELLEGDDEEDTTSETEDEDEDDTAGGEGGASAE